MSNGGDQRQIPMTFGTTSKMHPLIPDLAGTPTFCVKHHSILAIKILQVKILYKRLIDITKF